jgi:hypothetical protein
VNRDESFDHTALGAVHSLSYSQRLDAATEVFVTWSALCRDQVWSSSCHPVLFTSLRRTLNSSPGLLTTRRGDIVGIVFKDDQVQGKYAPGLPTLAGVEVVLDNVEHARTDNAGRFRFEDVPYGRHRVEARYASDVPTFFTTPSPADVDTGESVEFGIALSRSSLRGVVLTDAGLGLPGIIVHINGGERRITVRTGDDGAFVGEGLGAGEYDVAIETGSVPAGFPVDTLAPQRVRVERTEPGRVTFVLRPYRTVSGRARFFNRETGQYVGLSGATVEIEPLHRQSITDGNGQYAFRDLPSGQYKIVTRYEGHEHVAAVTVPEGPTVVRDVDVAVVPSADRARPERARVADARPASASSGAFTIQVAESNNARHARAMVNELKDAGHAAYLVEPTRAGAYDVRVGHYASLAEANESARSLERSLGWRMSVTAEQ